MITMAELDRQTRELVGLVDGWPGERLSFRPTPESWTVPEIFDHLARTECEIVAEAQRGLRDPHRIGLRDKAGVFFIDKIFRSERRVKTPASVKAVLPTVDPSLGSVLERWRNERVITAAFVDGVSPEQRETGIFRHPVAGWMNLSDVLNFFSVHLVHHRFQIARLEAASAPFFT